MDKQKRQRGVILNYEGLQKLQNARLESEIKDNYGQRYTLEQLSERTGLDINTIKKVWDAKHGVDKRTIERIFIAFNLELTKNYSSNSILNKQIDWGEAICTSAFYGRTQELALLEQLLIQEHCKLVALLGMGGIGKSALSVKLAEQVQDRFEYVIWRSLREAPPVKAILGNLLQVLSEGQETEADLPESVSDRVLRLVDYLREHRCLLILDNLESILRGGSRAGLYREGYEEYGEFLRLVGQVDHKSCLVLTSREKPKEIASLEGPTLPVRSLRLDGLQVADGLEIFKVKGLSALEDEWTAMIERYTGNPLALKIVSTTIHDIFDGNVTEFLQQEKTVFGDIHELLDHQFSRLPYLEIDIMYWLAINREPVSLSELREDLVSQVPLQKLLEALESLARRSLTEKAAPTLVEKSAATFTLQPVVMEYVTQRFVEQVCREIETQNIDLFRCHALIKATAKDYVRDTQIRLILKPVIDGLLTVFRSKKNLKNQLTQILAKLREKSPLEQGYTAGNVLNLLCHLEADLSGYDFSYLTVWQADLRNVNLHDVNFAHANLAKCFFVEILGGIHSVAFSPNGKVLATGDTYNDIRLYQIADGKQLLNCKGHTGFVWPISFSPDGCVLASGSDDQTVKLWDTRTGQCLATLEGHNGGIWSVAFSPQGTMLASSSEDKTIRCWDVSTGQCLKTLQGHSNRVTSVAFSPQGTMLASGSDDQTIKLWDTSIGQCLKTLQGHNSGIRSVAFSPDGQTLASGYHDPTIYCWDVSTGQCLQTLQGHTDYVNSVVFSSNGYTLASGSDDKTMKLWDINTGRCLTTLKGHGSRVWSVAFSPDSQTLASGSDDQTVRLWNVSTGQCLKTLQGYCDGIWSVTFSPDGHLVASGSNDQTVKMWDVSTGYCLKTFWGHSNRVTSVAFSPDGHLVASGSEDQTVKLWDVDTGKCRTTLQGHNNRVTSVAFSPDGHLVASGSEDKTVKVWDLSTGQCLNIFGHIHWVWAVTFSPDSHILASGCHDQTVRLWDISTGQCLKILEGHTDWIWTVSFSFDGRTLASGSSDQTVRLWDVSTGKHLKTLQGHTSAVYSVAFLDNCTLASSSSDSSVKIWDAITSKEIRTLSGHSKLVWSVAFSPQGKTLVSGSQDNTIKLWDVNTGEHMKTLRSKRCYESMNITDVSGLTEATITTLQALGAVKYKEDSATVTVYQF